MKKANELRSAGLRVGQQLVIPAQSDSLAVNAQPAIVPTTDVTRRINYRIKEGDSLSKIADVFRTSIQQLLTWNNQIVNKSLLRPGDLLTIYVKN